MLETSTARLTLPGRSLPNRLSENGPLVRITAARSPDLCSRLLVSRLDSRNDRELKQARTATAVNKQLNVTVKNKPHTTNYIYYIFEAYFMIKSV